MSEILKSPFPYFGGKSRVAELVWARLGDVANYVEPFAGSAAMLLRRPVPGKIETLNDANHYICNFWRAVQQDPEGVAASADAPVTEADLHARHKYLVLGPAAEDFRRSIETNPEYCDARLAGWWVWGQCCWIGGGWCDATGMRVDGEPQARHPHLFQPRGVHAQSQKIPDLAGEAGATGRGVVATPGKRPRLAAYGTDRQDGQAGIGVHALSRQRPLTVLGNSTALPGVHGKCGNASASLCDDRRAWLVAWMQRLADRLRLTRVCYGHWARICDSNTTMTRLGTTGAFLDPPYALDLTRLAAWIKFLLGAGPEPPPVTLVGSNRSGGLYAGDGSQDVDRLVAEVHVWCRRWGENSKVRIALCGYAGEHAALEEHRWTVTAWTAHGGYANRNADNKNKGRERIWFSPGCIGEEQGRLFA